MTVFLFQETTSASGWTLQNIAAIAGSVGAAVLAFAAFIKAWKDIRTDGWQPFKARWITPFKTRREERQARDKKLDEVISSQAEILKEIKPNGGASLRDRVDSIGDQVESTGAWIQHQKETSDQPIFKLDEDGRLTFTNCAFRELVVAEDSDLTYKKYLSRIEMTDRTRLMQELEQAISNLMPLDSTVHFKIDGPSFVAVRLQATPDVRHGGVLKGFFGTACKATAAEVEAALHGSHAPHA